MNCPNALALGRQVPGAAQPRRCGPSAHTRPPPAPAAVNATGRPRATPARTVRSSLAPCSPGVAGPVRALPVRGPPKELALAKVSDRLNSLTQQFIERSPFVCVATAAPGGGLDVSPRGDPAGFVRIVDEWTLLIPERPGNRIADSLTNLLADPR